MIRIQHSFVFGITLLLAGVSSSGESAAQESSVGRFETLRHDDMERNYLLHLPEDLPENAPLVFLLHGYRGDARDYMAELGMNRVADEHGFAVCYPQGAKDFQGTPHWNARLSISETDDIGFLSMLAGELQEKHKLDPDKTFACGISNGGFMSYTLVAEKPDVFKAAASVIGTMSGHTWKNRKSIQPVPIMQISGLADEVVPVDGSMPPDGGWGGGPNQDVMIEFWKTLNETSTSETDEISAKTTVSYYRDGINGNEVWHYKIKGFGHRVPAKRETGIDAVEEIWRFFSRF